VWHVHRSGSARRIIPDCRWSGRTTPVGRQSPRHVADGCHVTRRSGRVRRCPGTLRRGLRAAGPAATSRRSSRRTPGQRPARTSAVQSLLRPTTSRPPSSPADAAAAPQLPVGSTAPRGSSRRRYLVMTSFPGNPATRQGFPASVEPPMRASSRPSFTVGFSIRSSASAPPLVAQWRHHDVITEQGQRSPPSCCWTVLVVFTCSVQLTSMYTSLYIYVVLTSRARARVEVKRSRPFTYT